jgi:hypothetical protein
MAAHRRTFMLAFVGVALGWAGARAAAFVPTTDPQSMSVDHAAWQQILDRYLSASQDGINRFAYGRVSAADKAALKTYLTMLQGVKASGLGESEQRAFWINFYNALTIDVVLDHYPVTSIRDIGGGLFVTGPWKKELVAVEGRKLSLDNIEHDILRKTWRDPRVHYAVNCASISCPNLMAQAFTGAKLERMLNQGALDYVNHPRGARVERGRLTLSKIFEWYRRDFGSRDGEIIAHVAGYAEPKLKAQLADIKTIAGYGYDWSLNEAM